MDLAVDAGGDRPPRVVEDAHVDPRQRPSDRRPFGSGTAMPRCGQESGLGRSVPVDQAPSLRPGIDHLLRQRFACAHNGGEFREFFGFLVQQHRGAEHREGDTGLAEHA
nr:MULTISPECIES: hypothetical protein [Amycolatopsis]